MTMGGPVWEYGDPSRHRAASLSISPGPIFSGYFAEGMTQSGNWVTEDNALTVGVFLAGIRLISNAMAMCEIDIYRGPPSQGDVANAHQVYYLLNQRANDWSPAMTFRSGMTARRLLRGNAFAEIEWASNGKLVNLWPLHPPHYQVVPYNDSQIGLFYRVTAFGGTKDLLPENILHLRGFSLDGFQGLDLLTYCRESIGLARAQHTYASKVFANGARPGGYISVPGKLGEIAYNRMRTAWNERHEGAERAHRLGILEEGAEWKDASAIDESAAQLIESRQMTVEDFARILGVPLSKLRVKGATAFANQEDDGIDFVTNSLMPLMVADQQEYNHKLLGAPYECAHDLERLLTVNTDTRDRSFQAGIMNGWYNIDHVRAKLRLPPLPDKLGETYSRPVNMGQIGAAPAPTSPGNLPAQADPAKNQASTTPPSEPPSPPST